MDFKVTLTHGWWALSQSCVLIPILTLNSSLEDLPFIDEKDLTYYGSFSKLYLMITTQKMLFYSLKLIVLNTFE